MNPNQKSCSFFIDRGGTFTDVIMRTAEGRLVARKYLSQNAGVYEDAALAAVSDLLAEHQAGIEDVLEIRMGTTVATNALLEKAGEPTLLVTTKGFEDALLIGYQSRPDLFAQKIVKPAPLFIDAVGVDERLDAAGQIVQALDVAAARLTLKAAHDKGINAVAIVLMHGYLNPAHEQALAEIANEIGFRQVSVSSQVSRLIRFVPRGDTTVVDAYLSPILRRYVDFLSTHLGPAADCLSFMQSNGGLVSAGNFAGKDAILSGPAGGVVALSVISEKHQVPVIGFDMGGTSTDVARYSEGFERVETAEIAGVRISSQMLKIETVASGGGSICRYNGSRLRVGPQSAGADPGPACYRRGGPLTVTDCALIVGRIQERFFPSIFGPNGDQPLDRKAAEAKLTEIADQIQAETGTRHSLFELADGFLAIAIQTMAQAVKTISIEKGHDLATHALVAFGGAGGQHACRIAASLGMSKVIIHPMAGVMSAYGLGLASHRVLKLMTMMVPLSRDVSQELQDMATQAEAALRKQSAQAMTVEVQCRLMVKLKGADTCLAIKPDGIAAMEDQFHIAHLQAFGFQDRSAPLELERIEVEAIGHRARHLSDSFIFGTVTSDPIDSVDMFHEGLGFACPVYDRAGLSAGMSIQGPALISEALSTHVIDPNWQCHLAADGSLILTKGSKAGSASSISTQVDPITLELFNKRFMAIAEEMGARLQATAHSVNIKERLDFSCALFAQNGDLIANAPHMPVHLGSMGACVRHVMAVNPAMKSGDVFMHNDPYSGGTHLPDITVIAPVFLLDSDSYPAFYVAARGHHADVGGITPGSMPPFSDDIAKEGVCFDNVKIVEAGVFNEALVHGVFSQGPLPARQVTQNSADLKAQVAACRAGINGLRDLCARFGYEQVSAYVGHVLDNGEASVRRAISALKDGSACVAFDTGAQVSVTISVDEQAGSAHLDFTGTSAQQPNNLNAPLSITRAAMLYVFRTLIDEDIPLNEGCLRPLSLHVPEGCLLNPRKPAACAGGNVETSQVVVDALFQALGVMAGAQGTMNNFTFGNERYQYYETICGGSGAGPEFSGTDAVQTHMTNSRLTDPEILEHRFPVRLMNFAIRTGSGGAGVFTGGNGTIRDVQFLEPMTAAILSNRRSVPPQGLNGGQAAAVGINQIIRTNGQVETLTAAAEAHLDAGDRFIITTPGGGGYGKKGQN